MRSLSDHHSGGIDVSAGSMSSNAAPRPLPLKQRTSSVDTRRDYSMHTLFSSLSLIKAREYLITVDNFSIWRRHLAWAMENGADLRSYMTQRFASNMVFMSLLLGAELNVLFNSAAVTTSMRRELFAENFWSIEFWAGMTILVSVILTILSLISTFTVWGMVSSVSDANAHCILRSSIGQYVAELPGRFIVTAVYSFLIWVSLFFFLLLPVGFWSILLLVITAALFFHVVIVFSCFGRIIMHTGAMGTHRVFDEATEKRLLPHSLHSSLIEKAKAQLEGNTSIMRQYRKRPTTASTDLESGRTSTEPPVETRKRTDSTVRFADTLWSNVPPRERPATTSLSDIASERNGAETPSSQVSLASSTERMEQPKRPPRPTAAMHASTLDSNSCLDALGGSTHSLEEWLKASGTSAKSQDGGEYDARQAVDKTVNEKQSIGQVVFGEQARDGQKSISPIDFDTSEHGQDTLLGARTSFSVYQAQATTDASGSNVRRQLTEEEKFDVEYGELFEAQDDDVARTNSNDSQGYEVELGHEDSDLELSGQDGEQQRLLPDGGTSGSTYAAVNNNENQEKKES